jgi:3-hydroxybutyryl-CoA dehydrogenase
MEKLTVIGSGTMGHSLTLSAAWSGIEVKMYGTDMNDINTGLSNIEKKLERLNKKDLFASDQIVDILNRILVTSSLPEAIKDCSFIIEAIPEDEELKKGLFKQLSGYCGREVIIASNTSGLSPSLFVSSITEPKRFIVTHFWNPAHLIPLVEVVPVKETSKTTIQRTLTFLKQMKKKAIVLKKEIPGFVANRLQFSLFREAQYLLEKGIASPEDIDAAVTYSFGRRLSATGPLASADMGGLDIFSSISDYLFVELSNAKTSSNLLKSMLEKGDYGSKSGRGFYEWTPEFMELMNEEREDELIRQLEIDRKKHQK